MATAGIYNGDALCHNKVSALGLGRRLASGAEGCGFDPRLAYHETKRDRSVTAGNERDVLRRLPQMFGGHAGKLIHHGSGGGNAA